MEEIVLSSEFDEIFSGKFIASKDTKDRTHNLKDLTEATVRKGDLIVDRATKIYTYSPSWEPSISCVVTLSSNIVVEVAIKIK